MIGAGNEMRVADRLYERNHTNNKTAHKILEWDKENDPTGSNIPLKNLAFMTGDDVLSIRQLNGHRLKYKLHFSEYIEIVPTIVSLLFVILLWGNMFGMKLVFIALIPVNIMVLLSAIAFRLTRGY